MEALTKMLIKGHGVKKTRGLLVHSRLDKFSSKYSMHSPDQYERDSIVHVA